MNDTCELLGSTSDFSLIVDLTWGGWEELREKADAAGFPYLRLETENHQFVQVRVLLAR